MGINTRIIWTCAASALFGLNIAFAVLATAMSGPSFLTVALPILTCLIMLGEAFLLKREINKYLSDIPATNTGDTQEACPPHDWHRDEKNGKYRCSRPQCRVLAGEA